MNKPYLPVHIIEFEHSLIRETADLFIETFSRPPWNDVFESKDTIIEFIDLFYHLPNFKGYQLISDHNRVIGLSIGFIKPWLKDGTIQHEYFIDQFCIDHTLQGKGLGKFFISKIEEDLKQTKVKDLILNTELSSPAFHFYTKIGFTHMEEYGFLAKEL